VRGQVQGVRGSRMLKSPAKGVVVLISSFDTARDAERFRRTRASSSTWRACSR
jgi:hypothetical protein